MPSRGDKRVGSLANELGRACVIFVNKWDLASGQTPREFGAKVRADMAFLDHVPIVVGSALEKRGMDHLLETCADVANNHAMRLTTGELNRVIHEAMDNRPYASRGREFKVYYATQVSVKPPTFVLFVNDPKIVHETYMRYLKNQLRASFGFSGTPIRLINRKRVSERDGPRA